MLVLCHSRSTGGNGGAILFTVVKRRVARDIGFQMGNSGMNGSSRGLYLYKKVYWFRGILSPETDQGPFI